MLQPLTYIMPDTVKLKWKYVEQKAFDETKWIVACDTILS